MMRRIDGESLKVSYLDLALPTRVALSSLRHDNDPIAYAWHSFGASRKPECIGG